MENIGAAGNVYLIINLLHIMLLLMLLRVHLGSQEIYNFFSNCGILKIIYEQYLYVEKDFPEYIKWLTVKHNEYQNRFPFRRYVLS